MIVVAQARYSGNHSGSDGEDSGDAWWSPRDEFGAYPWDPSWGNGNSGGDDGKGLEFDTADMA